MKKNKVLLNMDSRNRVYLSAVLSEKDKLSNREFVAWKEDGRIILEPVRRKKKKSLETEVKDAMSRVTWNDLFSFQC